MLDLDAILPRITEAETPTHLWETMLDVLHGLGVHYVSYHAVNVSGPTSTIVSDGFPEDWVSEYLGHNYLSVDPIPELAARMSKPFYWHEIRDLVEHDEESELYLDALEKAHLGDGLALYVFGPGLKNAYVGLGFKVEKLSLTSQRIAALQCLVQAAHLRYCSIAVETVEELTERELDVLRWIARGKSNSVIADLLGISHHTVDAHVRNIYRKLGVADRTSAAIRGLGCGVIQYPDPVTT